MKNKTFKGFIMGMLTTIILLTAVSTFAAGSITKNISVLYNNIKIAVDGKQASLGKDSTGKAIEPFIYNGTTYLPVRAVGEAFGERVHWDSKTQTVYVGERPGEVKYLTEVLGAYANTGIEYRLNNNTTSPLVMAGNKYNTGYNFKWSGYMLVNLNNKYNSITFDLGTSDTAVLGTTAKVHVYLDGKLYKTYVVKADDLPKNVTVPLKGVNQLKVHKESSEVYVGIGNPILN